jgi:hypothetical protein
MVPPTARTGPESLHPGEVTTMKAKQAWQVATLVVVAGIALAGGAAPARADDDLLRRRHVLRPPQAREQAAPIEAPRSGGPVVPIDPPETGPPQRDPQDQAPAASGWQSAAGRRDWWQRVLQTFAALR